MYTYMCVGINIYIYKHVWVNVHIHPQDNTYIYVYYNIYIYICLWIYIYIYVCFIVQRARCQHVVPPTPLKNKSVAGTGVSHTVNISQLRLNMIPNAYNIQHVASYYMSYYTHSHIAYSLPFVNCALEIVSTTCPAPPECVAQVVNTEDARLHRWNRHQDKDKTRQGNRQGGAKTNQTKNSLLYLGCVLWT